MERQVGRRDGARRIDRAGDVQRARGLAEPASARAAEQPVVTNADVLEKQFTQIAASAQHRLKRLAFCHARRVGIDQEQAEFRFGLAGFLDACDQHAQVEMAGVGDPGFRAVDDPLITLFDGGGFHRAHVRACMRLGEEPFAHHFAAGEFRDPELFLRRRAAEQNDVGRGVGIQPAIDAGAGWGIAMLLITDRKMQKIAAAAAIFLRHAGAK